MSDLTNGSMKKGDKKQGPSIYDIEQGSGISIGVGWEDQVTTKVAQQQYNAAPTAMSLPEQAPASMERLDEMIDNSSLTTESKLAMKRTLHDHLIVELKKGDQANVLMVKEQLAVITNDLPDLRIHLRSFIENQEGVSKVIRLLSNKLLD
jgi:hypothetical protein